MVVFFISITLIFVFVIVTSIRKIYLPEKTIVDGRNEYLKELESQLNEVIDEFKNGNISEEEFGATKFEIDKRILKEIRVHKNRTRQEGRAPPIFSGIFLLLVIPLLILGTSAIYLEMGYYGFEDQPQRNGNFKKEVPFTSRLNQQQAELLSDQPRETKSGPHTNNKNEQLKSLVYQLTKILVDRPKDLRGHNLLVDNAARLGDYRTSYTTQKYIIKNIKSSVTADDYGKLAELMIAAANGYVSIEAEDNIKKSLHLNSSNHRSRYYYGLLKLQKNKLEEGYTIWKELLMDSSEKSPWQKLIKQDLLRLENMLDLANHSQLSLKEKLSTETMEMINEMVLTLSDRLETEGGTYEDWLKLVNSYLVLGKNEQASKSLQKAIRYFENQPDVLNELRKLEPLTKK